MFSCQSDFHGPYPAWNSYAIFISLWGGATLGRASGGFRVSLNFENLIVSYF